MHILHMHNKYLADWDEWQINSVPTTQQPQLICTKIVQRRPNVFDVGPTLYKCYTNVLRLLGRPVHNAFKH